MATATVTEIEAITDQVAGEPARARDQAMEVQQHSIGELIELEKHRGRKAASANPFQAIGRRRALHGRPGGE